MPVGINVQHNHLVLQNTDQQSAGQDPRHAAFPAHQAQATQNAGRDGHQLEALARNVNELIESERARSTRYRESLDNLAHSLKTPLAVVRSQIEATAMIATSVSEVAMMIADRAMEMCRGR